MNDKMMKIAIFQKEEIRKQLHGGEWWFVISDVIVALTDSTNPSQYLQNLRRRDEELAVLFDPVEKGAVQFEHPLYYRLRPQAVDRSYSLGTPKASSASSNPSPAKKLSPSNAG